PEDSLLIQYGLPRRDAKHPHPDKGQWRPHPGISGPGSMRSTFIDWMNKELLPEALLPGGTYPIDYTLPHQAPRVPAATTKAPPATSKAPPAAPAASPVNKPSPKPVAPAPASPKPTAP
ncbi:MAG: hypothetical protein HC898_11590, partial [Phycisphaerales bacterium]|nr:hypothetical protein [Phycisphaerales bacterium]